jgi:hypothetical protein
MAPVLKVAGFFDIAINKYSDLYARRLGAKDQDLAANRDSDILQDLGEKFFDDLISMRENPTPLINIAKIRADC